MIELNRPPTHAGEILKEEFLVPLGITQSHLAKALHTSFHAINKLVNEKRKQSWIRLRSGILT
ncbi:helix-turn-helix transcriptional regulator [Sulfurovum riftiae]|uniref:Addiction module antidote protein n=1 Tax=Sulfurovum riftiae TaxID=1630136 RepID=A0A151CJ40_9BACT|nr:addiction module antidote protein [Sulfurovum riftiae]KYJ87545.1 addiction module antidote protein [Sulfurovum riftiae]